MIKYKCLYCNKDYSSKLDDELKKQFKNTLKFSNNDSNTFILLLRKCVYHYEHMDKWEKYEDITDEDYMHAKKVCKDFEIKNLSKYHDLWPKGDTLLLVDVLENFRKMCFKIYQLDHAKFISAPGLAWQARLK